MLTITEALAEIKTIQKRIEKKREFVGAYLVRQEGNRDPLEKEGGSVEAVRRERQAIADLEQRIVDLRHAITIANINTNITIGDVTRSIYDWLTWRRDVSSGAQGFLTRIRQTLANVRADAAKKQLQVVEGAGKNFTDVVVNVSETALAQDSERLEEMLGTLDGLLSLKNATVTITL